MPLHMACGCCDYYHTGSSNVSLAHGVIGTHFNGNHSQLAVVSDPDLPTRVDNGGVAGAAMSCAIRLQSLANGTSSACEVA